MQARTLCTMAQHPQQLRIVTYNVLSSALSRAEDHTMNQPHDLDPDRRLRKVKGLLKAEIVAHEPVICLQEVSLPWANELQTYFEAHNYTFINSQYGKPFNGYMGVAVAFPRSKYALVETQVKRISETRRWPRTTRTPAAEPSLVQGLVSGVLGGLSRLAQAILPASTADASKREVNVHEEARRRFNTMVVTKLELRDSGKQFVVGTYHMPCAFWAPPVMVYHTALAAKYLQQCARATPHVLAGDFNFKPGSTMYNLITGAPLEAGSEEEMPQPISEDDRWRPTVPHPMKSAYQQVAGAEPAFTNWNQMGTSPVFKDTLDYIFYAGGGLTATGVLPTPTTDTEGTGPYPNPEQPSDHILLAATFQLN